MPGGQSNPASLKFMSVVRMPLMMFPSVSEVSFLPRPTFGGNIMVRWQDKVVKGVDLGALHRVQEQTYVLEPCWQVVTSFLNDLAVGDQEGNDVDPAPGLWDAVVVGPKGTSKDIVAATIQPLSRGVQVVPLV